MTFAQRAAEHISRYLLTGMHHSTPEAKAVMAGIMEDLLPEAVELKAKDELQERLVQQVRFLRRRAMDAYAITTAEDHNVAQLLHDIRHS